MKKKIKCSLLLMIVGIVGVCVCVVLVERINLVRKVVCGNGVCLTCAGKITATIKGAEREWRYFVADSKCMSSNLISSLNREYADKAGNRWIVILDDRGFPFGDLYWVSENGIQISRNSLWDKMNLFGAWVVLSDVALNCTYDVRGYPKGLSAMIEVTACDDALRYVCRVSERNLSIDDTNIIISVDLPLSLLKR